MNNGYPTALGRGANVIDGPDLRGPRFQLKPIPGLKPINYLPPSETFYREAAKKEFGRRTATARNALLRRAAKRLSKVKLPASKVIDAVNTYQDFVEWWRIAQNPTLPRDPNVPSDVAIEFPPGSWVETLFDSSYQGVAEGNGWPLPEPSNPGWIGIPGGGGPQVVPCTYPTHFFEDVPYTPAGDIVGEVFPYGFEWSFWEHFDLRDVFPGPGELVGDTHGGDRAKRYRKVDNDVDAVPEWANPPRTNPNPDTVWIPVITRSPQPARWRDIVPGRVRGPGSDAGYGDPAPDVAPGSAYDPIPYAPPSIIIGPAPVTGQPDTATVDPDPAPGSVPAPGGTGSVAPPTIFRTPPGEKTKERKAELKKGMFVAAASLLENVPELLDAINALWKVLPRSCQTGYYLLHGKGGKTFYKRRFRASQAQRTADLYRCWNHIDLQRGLEVLVANAIEDRLYGQIGQASARAGNRLGLGRGIQFGPWDTGGQGSYGGRGYATGADQARLDAQAAADAARRGETPWSPDFDAGVQYFTRGQFFVDAYGQVDKFRNWVDPDL